MSKQDGKCNYCGKPADQLLVWDVVVCSNRCKTALDWLLDGVPPEEVYLEFPEGKTSS